jgi:hypothetical protein
MNFCTTHGDREALSLCHNCGKYFCKECLHEGREYYYCSSPECQKQFKIETGETAESSEHINEEKEYVKLDLELNQMDSAVFRSLMDDAGIDYHCASGIFFDAPAEFYVCADQVDEIEAILKNFQINPVYYSTKNDMRD